jgi:predicted porin
MQKISKRRLAKSICMAFLAVGVQSAAQAVDVGGVEIHGYGNQNYMQTNDNKYLSADKDGTWDNIALALVFAAKIDDKSKVWAQLHSNSTRTRLDWAFVDYQVNNNLVARVGQIKTPLGLYNEIRDVQFLQVAALLPALYQDAPEIAHEAFRGVSIVYDHDFGGGGLSLDAYLGAVADPDAPATLKNRRLLGGRVTYKTPVDGLKFMASAYNNKQEDTAEAKKATKKAWVLSADYANNNWDLKAEYANLDNGLESTKAKTYYVQAGYTFAEKWTPYVRYDYITTDKTQSSDPSFYQKTTSLGVGYKVNDSISVRVENHWNRGYALPVASGEVAAGAGETDWKMFAASVNFIF